MRAERFSAMILDGHKGAAIEVPFDPAQRWGSRAQPLEKGRRGHAVRGSIDGVEFDSAIVARSRRFFLPVGDAIRKDAGVNVGDLVMVSIAPRAPAKAAPEKPPAKNPATKKTAAGAVARKAGVAQTISAPPRKVVDAALKRVRALVAALPETSEKLAWNAPTFRVREKMFAMFVDAHHGDGRLALWCKAPPGAQDALVRAQPDHFFVPPYVGKGGWIGIHLNRGLEWGAIAALLEEGWRMTAPKRLLAGGPQRRTR